MPAAVRVCIIFLTYLSSLSLAASLYGLFSDVGALSPLEESPVHKLPSSKKSGHHYIPVSSRQLLPITDLQRSVFGVQRRGLPTLDLMEKRDSKRSFEKSPITIPRGGLMVSGRGWLPGFFDRPRNLYKRSLPSIPETEDFGTVYDVYVI